MKKGAAKTSGLNSNLNTFSNRVKRYIAACLFITTMVIVSQSLKIQEIIYPSFVTLSIGLWVLNKGVWRTKPSLIVILLTISAIIGVCIQTFSPLPLHANLSISFLLSFILLLFTGSILPPILSASLFPIFFSIDSWIYPISIFVGSICLFLGQKYLENKQIKTPLAFSARILSNKKRILRWITIWICFSIIAFIAEKSHYIYIVLPPIAVIFAEFSTTQSGFIKRKISTWITIVIATAIGCAAQYFLHFQYGFPQWLVCVLILLLLFLLFELSKKYFAPAGAMAFIPMLIPEQDLPTMFIQACIGSAIFIILSSFLSFVRYMSGDKNYELIK